jgi:trk system potassium uptake protein TrkA
MKIIISGAGSVGSALAKILVEEAHEVTVIDHRKNLLTDLANQCDLRIVEGYSCYPEVLEEASASDTELLVAVTADDEKNILTCQVADALYKIPTKIARLKSESYIFERDRLFNSNAIKINEVVAPERLVSERISKIIEYPGAKTFFEFGDMHISLVGVTAFYGGPLVGNPLSTLSQHLEFVDVNFVGIFRNNKPIIISQNAIIEAGDEVYFVTATNHVREVMGLLQKLENPYRKIMIYGGGTIGYSLAKLLENKYQVKLIDQLGSTNTSSLANKLKKTLVFSENNSLHEIFEKEEINKCDFFLAVSSNDENNIISSMLAKNMGARKCAALIQQKEYFGISDDSIDITLSPQLSTLSALLTFIRHADIKEVHSLRLGLSEVMEIIIHGNKKTSQIIGRKIKDITLPQGSLICALMREGISYIDCDDIEIANNDIILLFLADKSHIREIEKLVQPGALF